MKIAVQMPFMNTARNSPGRATVRTATATASAGSTAAQTVSSPATVGSNNPFAALLQNCTRTSSASTSTAAVTSTARTTATAPSTGTSSSTSSGASAAQQPGVMALASAIMNGTFKCTYVTDPTKLVELNPAGTSIMPNFYYASDDTASQLASLLGGKVVKLTPFGQQAGWVEPQANFVQLPSGQTVNAADLAYYARCGGVGSDQLIADLTQAINQGGAYTNYFQNGGAPPVFTMYTVGPPISGMTYPVSLIGSDGMVINPSAPRKVT